MVNVQASESQSGSQQPLRIFVGLKIAPDIAAELAGIAKSLDELGVRLIAATDIHLTLVPPWSETFALGAINKLQLTAATFNAFRLTFHHVCYGPHPRRPRLLWAECKATDELVTLRATLLKIYGQIDDRPFQPHVTLARIRGSGVAIARGHPIDRNLLLTQQVETVELFQSPRGGETGYRILASSRLGAATGLVPDRPLPV